MKETEEIEKPMSALFNINNTIIDIRKVEMIGELVGESYYQTYTIYFISGNKIKIPHQSLPRHKLINAWKKFTDQ